MSHVWTKITTKQNDPLTEITWLFSFGFHDGVYNGDVNVKMVFMQYLAHPIADFYENDILKLVDKKYLIGGNYAEKYIKAHAFISIKFIIDGLVVYF